MNIVLFGATGMIGQGVLRECLIDPEVDSVLSVGRSATGVTSAKLRELVHRDLLNLSAIESRLIGFDACFFCLGVSSAGMTEPAYRRITFDITIAVAQTLVRLHPAMTFVYVSGAGSDSSGQGRIMWARVKGQTENALLQLPFTRVVIFRPAGIVPLHGTTSRTRWYRMLYAVTRPMWPLLYAAFPRYVTTTEQMGRAMLRVARGGSPKPILETRDINAL
jgi:uncharacterized protein YbjT (DUF2867 family)